MYPLEYKLSKWRIALDAAYSYRISKRSEAPVGVPQNEWREFEGGLLSGYSYGVSITPFFNDNFGLGAKFAGSNYSSSKFGLTDKISILYFAPEIVLRVPTRNFKNTWIISAALGYAAYRETLVGGMNEVDIKKGGFKSSLEAGYDFRIGKGVFMGFKLAVNSGIVKVDLGGEDVDVSLSAIEIGGGIRF